MSKQKVQVLKKLHQQLSNQISKKSPATIISQTLNSYTEIMIKEDKNTRQIFDVICELGFLQLLQEISKSYHLEVLQTICLLLVNLQHQQSIAYLLSHSLMAEVIVDPAGTRQECLQYYISMLKTLSLRLNPQNLALFYNQKYFRFPLAEISSRYYNHQQSLVRTSSMNIIFTLMKIPSNSLVKFFKSYPFSLFYLHLVCFVRSKWIQIDQQLVKGNPAQDLLQDQKDFVMLLHDIMQLGYPEISCIIKHCIIVYLIKPILKSLLLPHKGQVSMILGLYLLLDYLIIFKEQKQLVEFACLTIFSPKINEQTVSNLSKDSYLPQSYSLNSVNTYLNKYQKETGYFYKLLLLPQTQKPDINSQLTEQLEKIKENIGYDLLTNQQSQNFWFCSYNKKGSQINNPIKQILYSLLKTKDDLMLQLITKLLLFFMTSNSVSNETLAYCGLLLQKDQKQINQNNDENLKFLTITYLSYLTTQMLFRTETLKCIFCFLNLLLERTLVKGISNREIQLIKQSFSRSLQQMRRGCKSNSKQYITYFFSRILEENQQKFSRIYQPNFLSLQIDIDNVQDQAEQLLFVFNSLRKLRYKYIKQTKLRKQYKDLELCYKQRFCNQSSQWKVGSIIELQDRSLTQCYSQSIKKSVIMVSDLINFILVKQKQNSKNNQVIILVNTKFKEVKSQLGIEGKLKVELTDVKKTHQLQFQSEYHSKMIYEKINQAKSNNIKQEIVFLLSYVQQCLNDL